MAWSSPKRSGGYPFTQKNLPAFAPIRATAAFSTHFTPPPQGNGPVGTNRSPLPALPGKGGGFLADGGRGGGFVATSEELKERATEEARRSERVAGNALRRRDLDGPFLGVVCCAALHPTLASYSETQRKRYTKPEIRAP